MGSHHVVVAVPGTCGELVQGILDGMHFHISCPIDRYAQVSVEPLPGEGQWTCPPDTPKAVQALGYALCVLGVDASGGRMTIASELPRGKGMASSTADVAGAIYAAGYAFGRPFAPEEVARLALAVEPTDGSIFPGIVAFDHREGRFFEPLGFPPPLDILILDFGGTVDTLEYNRADRTGLLRAMEADYREAFTLVANGIRRSDVEAVGAGATISARCHHRLFPRPVFEVVLRLAHEVRALGVNVAHSGTVLGLLLPSGAVEGVIPYTQRLSGLGRMIPCHLVGGGCRVVSLRRPEYTSAGKGVRRGGF